MIEIHPNLFIGAAHDYESRVRREAGWRVVHACKEPYHRDLLGYTTKGTPKDDPRYYFAIQGNRLYLNIVDTDDPKYIPKLIIDAALGFTEEGLRAGEKVLIHCNQGESRAPSLGLLYLAKHTNDIPTATLPEAEAQFRKLYPPYKPKAGMRGFLLEHWAEYVRPATPANPL